MIQKYHTPKLEILNIAERVCQNNLIVAYFEEVWPHENANEKVLKRPIREEKAFKQQGSPLMHTMTQFGLHETTTLTRK